MKANHSLSLDPKTLAYLGLLAISSTNSSFATQAPVNTTVEPLTYDDGDGPIGWAEVGDFDGDGNQDVLMIADDGVTTVQFAISHLVGADSTVPFECLAATVVPHSAYLGNRVLAVDESSLVHELVWTADPLHHFAPNATNLGYYGVQLAGARSIEVAESSAGVFGAMASTSQVQLFTQLTGSAPVAGPLVNITASLPGSGGIEVGDFNADGTVAEIAVVCDQSVEVLDSSGTTIFSLPGGAADESYLTKIHDPDFGGDLLVVVKRVAGSNRSYVFVIDADSSLVQAGVKVTKNVRGVRAGDMNGDLDEDVVVVDEDGQVISLLNLAPANFSSPYFSNTVFSELDGVLASNLVDPVLALGDLDHDGDVDAITGGDGSGPVVNGDPALRLLRNSAICASTQGVRITQRRHRVCIVDGQGVAERFEHVFRFAIPPQFEADGLVTTGIFYLDPLQSSYLMPNAHHEQVFDLEAHDPDDDFFVEIPLWPNPALCEVYLTLQARQFDASGNVVLSSPTQVYFLSLGGSVPPQDVTPPGFGPTCEFFQLPPHVGASCYCQDGGGGENGGGVGTVPRPRPLPPGQQ